MTRITEFLTNDHGRIIGAFEDYRELSPDQLDEKRQAMETLKHTLERHGTYVEEIIVPAVKDRLDEETNEKISKFMKEGHRAIDNRIEEMEKRLRSGNGDTTQLEEELQAAMNEHFEREEKILYPIFDEHLSNDEKEDLLDEMKGASGSVE